MTDPFRQFSDENSGGNRHGLKMLRVNRPSSCTFLQENDAWVGLCLLGLKEKKW